MHIHRVKTKTRNKVHEQILLRESYREPGAPRSAVKKRTLLNLTNYPPNEVKAIELALKHKNDLPRIERLLGEKICQKQGRSVGAVWVLWRLCQDIGLDKVIGRSKYALLCFWMILARMIDQGSRLSAVRLAKEHAACEILGLQGFNENDLYQALDWIDGAQNRIEKNFFKHRYGDEKIPLFLYDVTSSYLEGDQNEYGDWGYSRDKKRGKKQIVIGLLTDVEGQPVSIKVFKGNTSDIQTFSAQIEKAAQDFGCRHVTMVGDRGMIKSPQIVELQRAGFHYITAITKPQIRSLMKRGVLQLGLFDEQICEVEDNGLRYVLRRNPIRADEVAASRNQRMAKLKVFAQEQSQYLADHPKADWHKARMKVVEKGGRLKLEDWIQIKAVDRKIEVIVDQERLAQTAELDGCYCLKTDLPVDVASKQTVHDRYKDLANVETAFRSMKTNHLEMRPINVRRAERTRGHAFIVMLADLICLKLKEAWRDLDLTVEEGIKQLSTLCAVENVTTGEGTGFLTVPTPRDGIASLFEALNIEPPTTLPRRTAKVDTKQKLQKNRKKF